MTKKDFFINAIQLVPVDESTNIPTVLHYSKEGKIRIGSAALAEASSRDEIAEDFKVDLGNIDRRSNEPVERILVGSGKRRSAVGLTADFLYAVWEYAKEWLLQNNHSGMSVLLAEPLKLQSDLTSEDWLSNYRSNLKGILEGKVFQKVDFLPEPFAVFQYYRYGVRHPVVAESAKNIALVIDFGGGTFDVCIIETTKEGDISQSGRNSKPLAAASEAVGGYYVNRMIAEELIRKYSRSQSEKSTIDTALGLYKRCRGGENLSGIAPKYTSFIKIFHKLVYEIEDPKLTLCKTIPNWDLETSLDSTVPIPLPQDPFSESSKKVNVQFAASDLRDIFINRVWNQRLKGIISQTLKRGRMELDGAPLTVVLLSGGSANIGWLSQLIRRDFSDDLGDVQIIQLDDFQEVVAKGLAIECARRFFNPDGDFSSVTYNRLNLILDPDGAGRKLKPFVARTAGLPEVGNLPGVLLPSASALRSHIGKPLTWKVRLDKAPRNHLDYFFLRSSFDPEDHKSLQNVEERRLDTPSKAHFESALTLELTVKEDGTTLPKFIYALGHTQQNGTIVGRHEKECKPFYLDMTYSESGKGTDAYVGLDFGTSNTSVSFVSATSVQLFQKRAAEKNWMELSDLVAVLPYPLAEPLGRYLGQGEPSKLTKTSLEFFEGAMAVAAYIAYAEYCTLKGSFATKLFKNYTQRSVGPLWGFLQQCLEKLGNRATFAKSYTKLLNPEIFETVNRAVTFYSEFKHEKADVEGTDTLRPVQILANISREVFSDNIFGFFDQVNKQKFSKEYEGLFRVACGVPPFVRIWKYRGKDCFSPDEPFLLDAQSATALSLQPLIFWDRCPKHPEVDVGHCYLFDISNRENDEFTFKTVGYNSCVKTISSAHGLYEKLKQLKAADPNIAPIDVGKVEPT